MHNYDYIVYIGRFQPFHNGHLTTLMKALRLGQKVIMVLGSSNSPRTYKNPWTSTEREVMIRSCLSATENEALEFAHIEDHLYSNEKWLLDVRTEVRKIITTTRTQIVLNEDDYNDPNYKHSVALIGYNKDESSFYTKEFPDWPLIETGPHIKESTGKGKPVGSTMIRFLMFTGDLGYVESNVPPAIYAFLENFTTTEDFQYLQDSFDHYYNEEKQYKDLPYWMNFFTADAVVVQSNHVLLGKRKHHPGKGLWALPGGHVSVNETSYEAALRELTEETRIKVPKGKIIGSMVMNRRFDHPARSLRCRVTGNHGRTVTDAFFFKLDGVASSGEAIHSLPKVKGDDDLEEARWFPLDEVRNMRSELFEDHLDIIEYFVDRAPKESTSSW
jgi:bifunctional NMN adenylyltransferase/nudix hydrolase